MKEADISLIFLKLSLHAENTGWPTKMSLFFFGNNFYENKETFKIFSLQIPKIHRIRLVETL